MTLEQLRQLQQKIDKLITNAQHLKEENAVLKRKLASYEKRVAELETHFSTVQQDQGEMERTILEALDSLDRLEDEIKQPDAASGAGAVPGGAGAGGAS